MRHHDTFLPEHRAKLGGQQFHDAEGRIYHHDVKAVLIHVFAVRMLITAALRIERIGDIVVFAGILHERNILLRIEFLFKGRTVAEPHVNVIAVDRSLFTDFHNTTQNIILQIRFRFNGVLWDFGKTCKKGNN